MATNYLLEFIQNHPNDWEEKLSSDPYNLKISRDGPYVMFKYNQLSSDFSNPIVREARGIIFREEDWKCVRRAFDKFFNYGEDNAATIDWSTAVVEEKVDGTLVSAWFDRDKWHYSTNGTIDIDKAMVNDMQFATFGAVFDAALKQRALTRKDLERYLSVQFCYTFELVSPQTRVVVPYAKPDLYLTGMREMASGAEFDPTYSWVADYLPSPTRYALASAEQVVAAAEALPWDKEGYVVVDSKFRRVKIKSPAYVMAHYARNNNVITPRTLLEVVFAGEQKEFLTYASDYAEELKKVERAYHYVVDALNDVKRAVRATDFPDRKAFADAVKRQDGWKQGFLFAPDTDAESWARSKWAPRKWVELFEELKLI